MVHDSFVADVIPLYTRRPTLCHFYKNPRIAVICDGRTGSSRRIIERRDGPWKRTFDSEEGTCLVGPLTFRRS